MSLSEEEIEKLWRAYREHPSAYYVSKQCKVSRITVEKYCESEHWDERRQKIRDKARAIADDDLAQQLATDIEMVHDLKMKIVGDIEKQLKSGNFKPTIRDYERLLKLEQSLKDSLDSRTQLSDPFTWEWLDDDEDEDK